MHQVTVFLTISLLVSSTGLADIASTSYITEQISTVKEEITTNEKIQNKNTVNGYAGLDAQGKIDPQQIPTDAAPTPDSNNTLTSGTVWAEINSAWNDYY